LFGARTLSIVEVFEVQPPDTERWLLSEVEVFRVRC
jgi:hypothetical protein